MSIKPLKTLGAGIVLMIAAAGAAAQRPASVESNAAILREQREQRVYNAAEQLKARKPELKLDDSHSFRFLSANVAQRDGMTMRFQQMYRNLPVHGSQVIVHQGNAGALERLTGTLHRDIEADVRPNIRVNDVKRIVQADYAPNDLVAYRTEPELIIFPEMERRLEPDPRRRAVADLPNADEYRWTVKRFHLAFRTVVSAAGHDPFEYVVDAHTGELLQKFSSIQNNSLIPAVGTGESRWYGTVDLSISRQFAGQFPAPYILMDVTRGKSGVLNLKDGPPTDDFFGSLYQSAVNHFGNGEDWTFGTSTTGLTGQTAAVDVMYGIEKTWDMLLNVFGRLGRDGDGSPLIGRVHVRKSADEPYGDAYWDGTYANFGDGTTSDAGSRTTPSTLGHEFGHGIWSAEGLGGGGGEASGLNEGHGDIMGSLLEFYIYGADGEGSVLPTVNESWNWRDRMVKPWEYSNDGQTGLSNYVPNMGSYEVHVQGCAYGRAFIFLATGSSSAPTNILYSEFLPQGMVGIGVHKAAQIWYEATTGYLLPNPTFSTMRTAYLDAADDLYGLGSPEYKAVQNAFAAINVGSPAIDTDVPHTSMTILTIDEPEGSMFVVGSAADDMGVAQFDVSIDGVLQHSVLKEPGWAGYLDLTGLLPGNHSVSGRAWDTALKNGGNSQGFSLTGVNQLLQNTGFESEAGWTAANDAIWGTGAHLSFLGSGHATFGAPGDSIVQTVSIPEGKSTVTFSYRIRVEKVPGSAKANASMDVQILENKVVVATLDTHTHLTNTYFEWFSNGYLRKTFDLTAYKGKTIQIRFYAPKTAATRFRLDNVSLVSH